MKMDMRSPSCQLAPLCIMGASLNFTYLHQDHISEYKYFCTVSNTVDSQGPDTEARTRRWQTNHVWANFILDYSKFPFNHYSQGYIPVENFDILNNTTDELQSSPDAVDVLGEPLDSSVSLPIDSCPEQLEGPLTTYETAKLASTFCFFWFIANWSINLSLGYTSVASSTILSSTSGSQGPLGYPIQFDDEMFSRFLHFGGRASI